MSHRSFGIYTSATFHQPGVFIGVIFITNTHMDEFSTWKRVEVFYIAVNSLFLFQSWEMWSPEGLANLSKVTQLRESKAGFGPGWSVILPLCTASAVPKRRLAAVPADEGRRDLIVSLLGNLINDAFVLKQCSGSPNLLFSLQMLTKAGLPFPTPDSHLCSASVASSFFPQPTESLQKEQN